MNKNLHYQKGFGLVGVIVLIVVLLGAGGGAYKVSKNMSAKKEASAKMNATSTTDVMATTTVTVGNNGKGSLRDLFALGKDVTCTFNQTEGTNKVFGTVYLSGQMMRGDFSMQGTSTGAVETHMIKKGEAMFMWNGNEGVQMSLASMSNKMGTSSASASQQVDLDQKVDYTCTDWTKDDSKFVTPKDIKFMDINAMMKGSVNMPKVPVR